MSDTNKASDTGANRETALHRRVIMPEYRGRMVSRYVVLSTGQTAAKQAIGSDGAIRETFNPVAHGEAGQVGFRRSKSIHYSSVFAQGELSIVRQIVQEHSTMTSRHERTRLYYANEHTISSSDDSYSLITNRVPFYRQYHKKLNWRGRGSKRNHWTSTLHI